MSLAAPTAATHSSNNNTKQPPSKFTITAHPTTDIWRAPPSTRRFNAPLAHTSRGPLSSFFRAGLSLALPLPSPSAGDRLLLYDQGGLVLGISRHSGAGGGGGGDGEQVVSDGGDGDGWPSRWLKAGIEMFEGEPWLSVVGCDRWSDVSMVPLSWGSRGGGGSERKEEEERPTARVEVERAKEDALRVYWVVPVAADGVGGEKRVLIREANWFFAPEGGEEEGWDVSVAAYAARPLRNEKDVDEVLDVDFERFEVEWL
ncbi:hypothetical protein BK809_0005591 [Diplodia seriata]|uniref:Uncharacterized protein n=1 Tax=Diplodia seriata TaxID=420778 RepID=A0A1S8BMS5_9PEZI|nr:hypothetical protein BK809_0005591 [Diplodia seriata]